MKTKILLVTVLLASLFVGGIAHAQSQLSLTLTPPLFRLSLKPGESWGSVIKLVNTNPYDLTVFASTADFTDESGAGNAVFVPPSPDPTNTHSLGSWIEVPKKPIIIPEGATGEIPFSVHVPEGAEPGGHYGAIQVGTNPVITKGQSGVGVGSQVTSLFFVRVAGNIIESGNIRDFYADRALLGKAQADFVLKFENKGNVHLQPQGEIVITNMWGKVRGNVPVNKDSNFGNVLPGSTRTFTFSWSGEENAFEFGRYKALTTLAYGDEARSTIYRTTYFWIIPWKPLLSVLGGFIMLIWFVVWSARRYVRQALELERRRLGMADIRTITRSARVIAAPIRKSVADLSRIERGQKLRSTKAQTSISLGEYLWRYRFIFLSLLGVAALAVVIYFYFMNVLVPARDYQAVLTKPDKSKTVISFDAPETK